MFSFTVDNWLIKCNGKVVSIYLDKNKKNEFSIDKFAEFGMTVLPKKLHLLIGRDLSYANKYDKFMDKIFKVIDEAS